MLVRYFCHGIKIVGVTNAHSEQNSQVNYANSACISVPSGGSVSVGYQATNCTGFDTTLGSMTGNTNAHTGDGTAYTTKICATAAEGSQSLTFNISDPAIGFGTLVSSGRAMPRETLTAPHQMLLTRIPFPHQPMHPADIQWRSMGQHLLPEETLSRQ